VAEEINVPDDGAANPVARDVPVVPLHVGTYPLVDEPGPETDPEPEQLPTDHAPAEPTRQFPFTGARPVGLPVPALMTTSPLVGHVTEDPPPNETQEDPL
jgi:hypothetical protein